tara:strand:- start:6 stop:722 length:717 start_codon:yes stop_codon:yes gene_type:complete
MNKLNILGIIPARGGSKGLPGKNIKSLNGKPLIAYTIEAANHSEYINKLVLSTDDLEIAQVCSNQGVEIPFMRPAELATDTALAIDTYIYTFNRLKNEFDYQADIIVILQPTSPLRTTEDIDNAIKIFLDKQADSVISVCELEHPIERARIIDENGKIGNYNKGEVVVKNRADYRKVFSPNGTVSVVSPKLILEKKFYSKNTYSYIMPRERSIDIDNQFDFDIAEFLVRMKSEKFTTN